MKMKRFNVLKASIVSVLCAAMALTMTGIPAKAENPIVQTIYTADPSPLVVGDTLYVYTTRDDLKEKVYRDWSYMNEWRCFSTKDMINWTDHGQIAHAETFDGNGNWRAWAQDCVEMPIQQDDGTWVKKYFLVCPFNGIKIDIAVSDNPWGPFTDATPGKYLIDGGWGGGNIDPAIYIEDHGNPDDYEDYDVYLYWGNPYLRYCKLTNDLLDVDPDTNDDGVISDWENRIDSRFSDEDNRILGQVRPGLHSFNTYGDEGYAQFGEPTMNKQTTGKFPRDSGPEQKRCAFEEGPWLYKHEDDDPDTDDYFLFFVGGRTPGETVEYSHAPTPIGPWTYGALLMDREYGNSCIHPGVIDWNGKSYLFYLNSILIGGDGSNRSVCVKEFEYDENNLIKKQTPANVAAYMVQDTKGGEIKNYGNNSGNGQSFFSVDPIGTLDPYELNQAETICWTSHLNGMRGGFNGTMHTVKTKPMGHCTDKDESTGKTAFWKSAALYGVAVCDIDDGEYIKLREVDFGDKGPIGFTAVCASGDGEDAMMEAKDKDNQTVMIPNPDTYTVGGKMEIWIDYDNEDARDQIGEIEVYDTGGMDVYEDFHIDLDYPVQGVHDLTFIFRGESDEKLFNFDTWQFEKDPEPDPTPTPETPETNDPTGQQPVVTPTGQTPPNPNPSATVAPSKTDDSAVRSIAKVKGIKVKKSGSKAVVTWKKASGASKYEVQCSLKKNFKKGLKKITVKTNKAAFKKLKKGKTYWFRARGIGSGVKGSFSAAKKVKI